MHPAERRTTEEESRLVGLLVRITSGQWLDDGIETPSLIKERLYLGSVRDARNLDRLRKLRITHILNIAGDLYNPLLVFTTAGYDVTYHAFKAHDVDSYPIHFHFDDSFTFIDSALRKPDSAVLVHCAAGVSRSAAIVCAYLMRANKWTCYEAVRFVHKQRVCASPNRGFLRSLLRYEATVGDRISRYEDHVAEALANAGTQ